MKSLNLLSGIIITIVISMLVGGSVYAQQSETVEVDLSEEEKRAIAEAYVDLLELEAQYREEFADLQDPEEGQQVEQQLQDEKQGIIEDNGISLELYDQALRATQTDAKLRDELLALIEEVQEERAKEVDLGDGGSQ